MEGNFKNESELNRQLLAKIIPFIQDFSFLAMRGDIPRHKRMELIRKREEKCEEELQQEISNWVTFNLFTMDYIRFSKEPFENIETTVLKPFTCCKN